MKKATTTMGAVAHPIQPLQVKFGQSSLLIFVWIATLSVSTLPNIIQQEFQVFTSVSMLWMRVILLVAFIALGFVWSLVRPLRAYFSLFLVLYLADALFNWIGTSPMWALWFDGANPTFSSELFSSQLLRLGTAIVMVAALWAVYRDVNEFFFVPGKLNATAEPVKWIGMERPTGWRRFGLLLALCITLGTLAFLVIAGRPALETMAQVVPFIPIILIVAAMNAFSEEVTFRASLLAPLHTVVGKSQALLLTAALFGLWHFYGVPYGVIGVILAGVLGWLLGKSMLETKGMFWAWFIHFWQDVVIFSFIAIGSVTPGG
jgi:membrane protease YdiL (CAAX protease family)